MKLFLALLALVLFAQDASAQAVVFLVRHAEKADPESKDPDLSAEGRSRAEALAQIVKDVGVTAIFATEFKRTQQTAAPLSKLTSIPIKTVPAKDTAALIAKLKKTQGSVLVVGHSNTLPEIIRALGVREPITIPDTAYDDLFVVKTETSPPELIHRQYSDKEK